MSYSFFYISVQIVYLPDMQKFIPTLTLVFLLACSIPAEAGIGPAKDKRSKKTMEELQERKRTPLFSNLSPRPKKRFFLFRFRKNDTPERVAPKRAVPTRSKNTNNRDGRTATRRNCPSGG